MVFLNRLNVYEYGKEGCKVIIIGSDKKILLTIDKENQLFYIDNKSMSGMPLYYLCTMYNKREVKLGSFCSEVEAVNVMAEIADCLHSGELKAVYEVPSGKNQEKPMPDIVFYLIVFIGLSFVAPGHMRIVSFVTALIIGIWYVYSELHIRKKEK